MEFVGFVVCRAGSVLCSMQYVHIFVQRSWQRVLESLLSSGNSSILLCRWESFGIHDFDRIRISSNRVNTNSYESIAHVFVAEELQSLRRQRLVQHAACANLCPEFLAASL